MSISLDPDNPIKEKSKDRLGRVKFAERFAEIIKNVQDDESSFVVGIDGKWGSGKSSLVGFIETELKEEESIIPVNFNPWNFSGQDNLIHSFFTVLANAINQDKACIKPKKIAQNLKEYTALFGAVSSTAKNLNDFVILIISILAIVGINFSFSQYKVIANILIVPIVISKFCTLVKDCFASWALYFKEKTRFREKTLENQKKELVKNFSELNKKIVVIIDDIDRLNDDEIKLIFQLVKINADFPNIIYILSFDRQVVAASLKEQYGITGKEYLEKIIQLNLHVPMPQSSDLSALLYEGLCKSLGDLINKSLVEQRDLQPLVSSEFMNLFKTVRDIKRYTNSLAVTSYFTIKDNELELNPFDFLKLEAIRVLEPSFYSMLHSKKELIFKEVKGVSYNPQDNDIEEKIKKEYVVCVDKFLSHADRNLSNVFFDIFPCAYNSYNGYRVTDSDKEKFLSKKRICSYDMFDRYFVLDVPSGEIPQSEIQKVINSINSMDDLSRVLQDYIHRALFQKLMVGLGNNLEKINVSDIERMVTELFSVCDDIEEGYGDLGFDGALGVSLFLSKFFMNLTPEELEKTQESLRKAISSSRSILGPLYYVTHCKEQGDDNEFYKYKDECLALIKKYKDTDIVKRSRRFQFVLNYWFNNGDRQEVDVFLDGMLINDKDVLFLIKDFTSVWVSYGGVNDGPSEEMNFKSLGLYIDLERFIKRVKNVEQTNIDSYMRPYYDRCLNKYLDYKKQEEEN